MISVEAIEMNDKDFETYKQEFIEFMEKKTRTKRASTQFLKDIGVYTKKGNISSKYNVHKCTAES
jgi:hypothetical protein